MIVVAQFMVVLDATIVNAGLPIDQAPISTSARRALRWVITGYSIFLALSEPARGRLADRLGRRRVFVEWRSSFYGQLAARRARLVEASLIAFRSLEVSAPR